MKNLLSAVIAAVLVGGVFGGVALVTDEAQSQFDNSVVGSAFASTDSGLVSDTLKTLGEG